MPIQYVYIISLACTCVHDTSACVGGGYYAPRYLEFTRAEITGSLTDVFFRSDIDNFCAPPGWSQLLHTVSHQN